MNVGDLRAALANYPADREVLVLNDGENLRLKPGHTNFPPQEGHPTGAFCVWAEMGGAKVMILGPAEVEIIERLRDSEQQ